MSESPSFLLSSDLLPGESTGEFPELDDDDLIADGGTEVMTRPAAATRAPAEAVKKDVPPPTASLLDVLAAAIPGQEAFLPQAPVTAPLPPDPEDREDEPQRRIEKTQPFDRALIFGATPPPAPVATDAAPIVHAQPSAPWQPMPPSARPASIAPIALDVPREPTLKLLAVTHVPSAKSPLALAIGGAVLFAAAVLVTVAVRMRAPHEAAPSGNAAVAAAPSEAQTFPARASGLEDVPVVTPATLAAPTSDNGFVPVISPSALPSAPNPTRTSAGSRTGSRSTGR